MPLSPSPSLHVVLRKIQDGDESALEDFLTITANRVKGKITQIAGSSFDQNQIEGLYIQIVYKIWNVQNNKQKKKRRYSGETEGQAWSWVYKITRNHAISSARKQSKILKNEVRETDLIQSLELRSDNDNFDVGLSRMSSPEMSSPEEIYQAKEDYQKLYFSLNAKEKYIMDKLAEGYSQIEIAEELGLSPARISQIVKSLRKKANKEFLGGA